MSDTSAGDANDLQVPAHGPCTGIRVVDLTSIVSGPLATQTLADLGAEVIRVESPGSDALRSTPPLKDGQSAYFEQLNRGKKSIVVDLKNADEVKRLRKLIATADVFIQNSRPGVMERLGLGYEQLSAENERLIYLSINGFGEVGEFAGRPAYDMVIQGLVGFMPVQGATGGSGTIRSPVADKVTGILASNATLAALLHRERNDLRGQKVVVDMASAYAAFAIVDQMLVETFPGADLPRPKSTRGAYETLQTRDGEVIGLILQPTQFERMCKALAREDLLGNERFLKPVDLLQNTPELYAAIGPTVAKLTTKQFLTLMNEASVPFGPVNTIAQFVESPEAESAGTFREINDPELGRIRYVNYPAKFERATVGAFRRAPRLGEHTSAVFDALG